MSRRTADAGAAIIAGVVETPLTLRREYRRDGAGILGVTDLLERALGEAPPKD